MEDSELKNLWKAQDEKLDRTMKLNLYLLENLQKQKAESKLNRLARFKLWAVILGILWVGFLGVLIYGNQFKNPFFTVSVFMIMIFSLIAVIVYIKHIVLIKQLDYSKSITETQEKLSKLQTSTLNIGRFLWLQAPFHTTWFWSKEMIGQMDVKFWLISVPITVFFTILALWLYKNLTPENMDKKWVKAMLKATPEYTSVSKARDFLNEIEHFKTSV